VKWGLKIIFPMKDDIKRAVRASQFSRAPGDAPSLGRVARMPGTGLPKKRRRKKKRDSEGRTRSGGGRARRTRRRAILGWSILLSLGMLAILGVAVGFWLIPKMREPKVDVSKLAAVEENKKRVATRFSSPSEVDAIALVKAALAVREPSGVQEHLRLGSSEAQEAVDFLTGLEASEGAIQRMEWLSRIDANGLTIDGVVVRFDGGEKQNMRLALLTPDDAGVWKLDFESFARKCTPPLADFVAKGMDSAQVRVFAIEDNYYNGFFGSESEWKCYAIRSPDLEETLFAYAKLETAQAEAMAAVFTEDQKAKRVTLEIRPVEAGNSRQFEISRVLAEGWIISEKSFDQIFD
jgi:hypothetical protein